MQGDAFTVLLNFIADPVIAVDSKGTIVAANDASEKYLEAKKEDLEGKSLFTEGFFEKETLTQIKLNLKNPIKEAHVATHEIKLMGKNGKVSPIEFNDKKIKCGNQVIDVIVFRDVTDVGRLHSALQDSEEKFNGIAHSIKDALILVDEKTRVTYWNPAAEKTFGYTAKEALSKKIHDLIVPSSMCREGLERIEESLKVFSETGMGYFTVEKVDLIGRKKDGTEFPVELSISPLKSEGKWMAVGVVKDLSLRKLNEQKLREAEQRYHSLFNHAPLGIVVVDPAIAKFIEFNDIAHLQLGYTREEFEKISIADIEAKEAPQQVREHIKEMLLKKGAEFETLQKTKNGEIRNVIVTVRTFQLKNKTLLQCMFHDITESKKVQTDLAKSETQYRQLVELAEEGIWAVNNDMETVFVNPRMAQMLGYSESDMIGKSLMDFLEPALKENIRTVLSWFEQNGRKGHYEYAFPRKNGGYVETAITLSDITDDQNSKIGILAVISDITERKKAEKALKESEEISRAIVASSPIGIATSDSTYHFVSANEAFCNILGYSEEELRKLTFKDVSHPSEISIAVKNLRELESGEISSFTQVKRYIKKDGAIIVGRVIISTIRSAKGKPVLFIVELEDITRHKQLEDNLRGSEERFRAISTHAMDAIILSNQDDQVLYWNPAAEKIFGYTSREVLGKKLSALVIPPRAYSKHAELLMELKEKPISKRHFGFTALKKDGSTFPMDLAIISVKLNGKNCLLTIIRDITEWKAMEEALRQEKDLLESVTASTDIVLSIVDRNYRITWANEKAKETSKCKDIENRHCYEVFGGKRSGVCPDCGVRRVFEKGEALVRRDYSRKSEGKETWVELISTPIKDKDGNVIAALEVATDINERKRLQNKLAQYSQRLEETVQLRTEELRKTQGELVKSERLAAIGELAGMVGHDLRNPLTGIKNSVFIMKKKSGELPSGQSREMLEIIDKCVDYSNRIINDLLDYSREIHLAVEEASPKQLLAESLALMDIPLNVEVKNKLKDTPTVKVDLDKTKRVFINLIKNAIDAMPHGGKITVSSRILKGGLEVLFADSGVGISEEVMPKLFSPLFTTKAKGMGFGLAICKRIVEAHGGAITVTTVKDKGTTFKITLPYEQKIKDGGENLWISIPEYSLSTTTKQSEQR